MWNSIFLKFKVCTFFQIHIYIYIYIYWTYWGNSNNFSYQVAKKKIQKFIHMKKLFWEKKSCKTNVN